MSVEFFCKTSQWFVCLTCENLVKQTPMWSALDSSSVWPFRRAGFSTGKYLEFKCGMHRVVQFDFTS